MKRSKSLRINEIDIVSLKATNILRIDRSLVLPRPYDIEQASMQETSNAGANRRRALTANLTQVPSLFKQCIRIRRPPRLPGHTADRLAQGLSERQIGRSNIQVEQSPADASVFLHKLPAELRVMIYQYVFQGYVFHLRRLPLDITPPRPSFDPRLADEQIPPRKSMADHPLLPRRLEGPEPPSSLLNLSLVELTRDRSSKWALLLTCRQIHREAVQVFYGASTLRFDDPYVLTDMAAKHLPRPSLQAVRCLEIVWRWTCPYSTLVPPDTYGVRPDHPQVVWDRMWALVAEKMRISVLRVWILIDRAPQRLKVGNPGLQSLLRVRGLSECAIFVGRYIPRKHDRRVFADLERSLRDRMRQNGNIIAPQEDI